MSSVRCRGRLNGVWLAPLLWLAAAAALLLAGVPAAAEDALTEAAAPASALDDPAFLGRSFVLYDMDESVQLFGRANVFIGHSSGRSTHAADRVVLGERGLYLHWGLNAVFFPAHSFTVVEISAQDAGALVSLFADDALWRRSWGPTVGGLINFTYEVDGTTYNVAATDALITPEYLILSLNSGHTLRIVKYEAIDRIEIVQ